MATLAFAVIVAFVPGVSWAKGSGTKGDPYIVTTGTELDAALTAIGEDFYENGDTPNISDMHYISLAGDIDAVTSATYGAEDDDHPVRVTVEGNGHAIRGVLPDTPPSHAAGNKYTGLRFANRTPFTENGHGNHIVLKNLTVKRLHNAESHGGGALALFGGNLEVEGCVFEGNAAYGTSRGGGAILLQHRASLLSIKNSTFVTNTSIAPGGAVDSSGDQSNAEVSGENVMIENSTFYGNKSTGVNGAGGAITYSRALGRITNCTIVGNEATTKGGGVYARYDIAGNPSGLGTKVNIGLFNSIVAGNSGINVDLSNYSVPASADISGNYDIVGILANDVVLGGNSLTGADVSTFLAAGAPKVNTRGTPTIALLDVTDSPAIGKADSSRAPATDQRGFQRDGDPDIGAFEYVVPGGGSSGCNAGIGGTAVF